MLSLQQIKARLDPKASSERRLVVRPGWIRNLNDSTSVLLDADEQTIYDTVIKFATNERLAVCLGALVQVCHGDDARMQHRWHPGNGHTIVDISKPGADYAIYPGETVIAASSEYFDLPPDLCGIVLPRASNSTSGIGLAPTFIDAGWRGVLLLQVSNLHSEPRYLRLGAEVARVFFMELSSPVVNAREGAHADSNRFGSDWRTILRAGLSPFELNAAVAPPAPPAPPEKTGPVMKAVSYAAEAIGVEKTASRARKTTAVLMTVAAMGGLGGASHLIYSAASVSRLNGDVERMKERLNGTRIWTDHLSATIVAGQSGVSHTFSVPKFPGYAAPALTLTVARTHGLSPQDVKQIELSPAVVEDLEAESVRRVLVTVKNPALTEATVYLSVSAIYGRGNAHSQEEVRVGGGERAGATE